MGFAQGRERKWGAWVLLGAMLLAWSVAVGAEPGEPKGGKGDVVAHPARAADHARKLLAKARALLKAGKSEQAAKACRKAQAALDAALAAYEQALVSAREDQRVPLLYERARLLDEQVNLRMGLTDAQADKKVDLLAACLAKITNLDPAHVGGQKLMCDLCWRLALAGRIRPETFIVQAGRVLELDGTDHRTWHRRGYMRFLYVRADGPDARKALADLKKAIELKGDVVKYWRVKADLEENMDRLDQAGVTYQAAIKANPKSAALRMDYAGSLARRDMPKEARKQVDEAVRLEPDSLEKKLKP